MYAFVFVGCHEAHLACLLLLRFEPYLRRAVSSFVATHLPDYSWMSHSRQRREFWVAIYGLSVIHKYDLCLRLLLSRVIAHCVSMYGWMVHDHVGFVK